MDKPQVIYLKKNKKILAYRGYENHRHSTSKNVQNYIGSMDAFVSYIESTYVLGPQRRRRRLAPRFPQDFGMFTNLC